MTKREYPFWSQKGESTQGLEAPPSQCECDQKGYSLLVTFSGAKLFCKIGVERGEPGSQGVPGEDGFSPSVTVTQTATGATITITDKSGTTTADIANGERGPKGDTGDSYVLTSADKSEIAQLVLAEMPTAESEAF